MYERLSNNLGRKIKIGEIYYGGGSPTYYNEEDFLALTNKLKQVFD
jgi:coproporphyrinogen III oxidase-like Fe-S oxidoreductase